jgi:hypothetical protein
MAVSRPLFTENFSSNLVVIESFLGPDGASYFSTFFDRFVDEIVPLACRFPLSGRSFPERSFHSSRGQGLVKRLKGRLQDGDDIRELIVDEFLVLYLVRGDRVVFLSIKHHRQLSYDLKAFWRE